MEKQAEETFLEQVKKTLGGYRDQVADFWNDTHASAAMDRSGEFLKNWAVPAGVTTLGAGALAGALTAQGERPGETKRERTMRILRNAVITSGATGLGWLGAAGAAGLEPATDLPRGSKLTDKVDAAKAQGEDTLSSLDAKNYANVLSSGLLGGTAYSLGGKTIPAALGATADATRAKYRKLMSPAGTQIRPNRTFGERLSKRPAGRFGIPALAAALTTTLTDANILEWPGNIVDYGYNNVLNARDNNSNE